MSEFKMNMRSMRPAGKRPVVWMRDRQRVNCGFEIVKELGETVQSQAEEWKQMKGLRTYGSGGSNADGSLLSRDGLRLTEAAKSKKGRRESYILKTDVHTA